MSLSLFSLLAFRLIPLYANIALGFLAGKFLKVQRESIVNLTFYLIVPIVVFTGVSHARFSPELLLVPFVVMFSSSFLAFTALKLTSSIWHDKTPRLLAFAAGTANTGYFGIPVASILFPKETVAVYIVCMMGVILFEYTIGYYITARSTFTARQSAIKVMKLPSVYAFILGMMVSASGVEIPQFMEEFGTNIKACYSVLGMMIIGIGLSSMKKIEFDFKYIGFTQITKYLAWPLLIFSIIQLDINLLNLFNPEIYKALMLLAIMPMAANTVIFASLFDCAPEKAAFAVLISTFLALLIIPVMAHFFII